MATHPFDRNDAPDADQVLSRVMRALKPFAAGPFERLFMPTASIALGSAMAPDCCTRLELLAAIGDEFGVTLWAEPQTVIEAVQQLVALISGDAGQQPCVVPQQEARVAAPETVGPLRLELREIQRQAALLPWAQVSSWTVADNVRREDGLECIDLHGLSIALTSKVLYAVALHERGRTYRLVHGQGHHSRNGAVLRDAVRRQADCLADARRLRVLDQQPGHLDVLVLTPKGGGGNGPLRGN